MRKKIFTLHGYEIDRGDMILILVSFIIFLLAGILIIQWVSHADNKADNNTQKIVHQNDRSILVCNAFQRKFERIANNQEEQTPATIELLRKFHIDDTQIAIILAQQRVNLKILREDPCEVLH